MSRPRPSGRSYGRLTRHERNAIERMLDRNRSAREIAAELGRSPSTVTREVAAHRYVTAPRSRYGEPAPEDLSGACPRLAAWPRCCNGCSHRRGYGCSRRPTSRFQLALPLPDGACASVLAALSSLRAVLGEDGARRAFGAVLTDNGSEFADEDAIAALLGERDGETRLFYCDPRQSQQKGACEKNHVEIRKLLPKGAGVRFDRLTAADCALLMSQVNSEPRGALGFLTPARVLRMALGEDASALMDAFGVEELAPGGLDLTPGCIDRARAARGEGPLAG